MWIKEDHHSRYVSPKLSKCLKEDNEYFQQWKLDSNVKRKSEEDTKSWFVNKMLKFCQRLIYKLYNLYKINMNVVCSKVADNTPAMFSLTVNSIKSYRTSFRSRRLVIVYRYAVRSCYKYSRNNQWIACLKPDTRTRCVSGVL